MDGGRAGSPHDWLLDGLLAVALAGLSVSSLFVPDPSVIYEYPPPTATVVGLTVLAGLALTLRRRLPSVVFAVSLLAIAVITLAGWNTGITPVCLVFALYASAAWQRIGPALACLCGLYLVFVVAALTGAPYFETSQVWISAGVFTIVWGAGVSVRMLRLSRQEALRRAAQAETDRTAAVARAALEERLRIARELHDVVAHTLSVIAVQSGVARHLLGAEGEAAAPLAAIEEASRTALDDLRRVVGLLRISDGSAAGLAPTPGVDELRLLVAAHRASHGPVRLEIHPAVERLPESARLTAFRLVQETLTNARRHAPGAAVWVVLRPEGESLSIEVGNDPPPASAPTSSAAGTGFGLLGMRERAALFGGDLTAGPTPDGGWRVRAVLQARPDQATVLA